MELFKNSSFSILRFIYSETSQQSDGSCNVSRDTQSLHDFFRKTDFFSANANQKYIVSEKFSSVQRKTSCASYPIVGNTFFWKETLKTCCKNWLGWLYTFLKYQFNDKIVVKSGQVFDIW